MSQFPFNYFCHIFNVKKMFQARHQLAWWQMIFISLFLIALLMMPVTIHTVNYQTYPMTNFVSEAYDGLTDENIHQAHQQLTIKDNQLSGPPMLFTSPHYHVIYFDQAQLANSIKSHSVLFFDHDHFTIYQQNKKVANIYYQNISNHVFTNKTQLTQYLNQTWYNQNKIIVISTLLIIASGLLTFNFVFISLGAALFLLLTRRAKLFHFYTFKSCFNFILNCLGLPTICASLMGFIHYDIVTIITIQNILFVLILITVFYQTHFRD